MVIKILSIRLSITVGLAGLKFVVDPWYLLYFLDVLLEYVRKSSRMVYAFFIPTHLCIIYVCVTKENSTIGMLF